jgi:hypothetical protein
VVFRIVFAALSAGKVEGTSGDEPVPSRDASLVSHVPATTVATAAVANANERSFTKRTAPQTTLCQCKCKARLT